MEALQQLNALDDDSATGISSQEPETGHAPVSMMIGQRHAWPAVESLLMQLDVALPIARFRVSDLLALDPGQIISTAWSSGDDLPLSIEDVQLGWVEMEAVDQEMTVRITRLL
jgi:flagellar motor switch/type III secretory pathway protein FliN